MYNPDWLRYCKRVVRAGLGTDHLLAPEVTPPTIRIGSDYGGWVVAQEPLAKARNPIVLSFGLGDDISFDAEITRLYGAKVYGFDPTPICLEWLGSQPKPANMELFPIGIAARDGQQTFMLPTRESRGNFSARSTEGAPIICQVMRYESILAMLRLEHVDVLKLDVEGSEYDVIPDILTSSILPVQLLVEFHHRLHDINVRDSLAAVDAIKRAGFSLFAVSPGGQELSFIKREPFARCTAADPATRRTRALSDPAE